MQGIADKIRHYKRTFRPPVLYALDSSALWLTVTLASVILGLLFTDLYLRVDRSEELLAPKDQAWLLVSELPMLLGMLQVHLLGAQRRYLRINPASKRVSLRTPHAFLRVEKNTFIRNTFSFEGNLRDLAKTLVGEWEWRRDMKRRSLDPLWARAIGFFSLPSASNFAAYVTGFIAILAGIVIASMQPDAVFGRLDDFIGEAWSLTRTLWLVIVLPFAACVLPGAVILSLIRVMGDAFTERLNDQYLSNMGFYRFIAQLLELYEQEGTLLLRKTRARAYWMIRLSTAPIAGVPAVWRRIRRARRLVRLRKL
jgi:hypothetical protein